MNIYEPLKNFNFNSAFRISIMNPVMWIFIKIALYTRQGDGVTREKRDGWGMIGILKEFPNLVKNKSM